MSHNTILLSSPAEATRPHSKHEETKPKLRTAFAVWAECERVDGAKVASEEPDTLAGCNLPETNGLITRARRYVIAVGMELDTL